MSQTPIFTERMRWPWWLWFLMLSLVGAISFSIWAALGIRAAFFGTIVQIIGIVFWSHSHTLLIEISEVNGVHRLRVDQATLDTHFIHDVIVLDQRHMALARTRDADPGAFLGLRFWIKAGVKVSLEDLRDPTRYWLVSTRRGDELAKLLMRSRGTLL